MLLNRERALATMEKYDLEALVATSAENVYYLSDYFTEHLYHFAPAASPAPSFRATWTSRRR